MNTALQWFNIIAGLASIAGVTVALVQTRQLRKAVKTHFLLDLHRITERIERNKAPFKESAANAYKELLDTQAELDTLRQKFIGQFGE